MATVGPQRAGIAAAQLKGVVGLVGILENKSCFVGLPCNLELS